MCTTSRCNNTVANYSKHSKCFECVKIDRRGIPCEPGTLCRGSCDVAFAEDPDFARAMLKGQRDRKSAKERSAKNKPPQHDTDEPPPLPPKPGISFVKWREGLTS